MKSQDFNDKNMENLAAENKQFFGEISVKFKDINYSGDSKICRNVFKALGFDESQERVFELFGVGTCEFCPWKEGCRYYVIEEKRDHLFGIVRNCLAESDSLNGFISRLVIRLNDYDIKDYNRLISMDKKLRNEEL